jgi:hypothetical protein
MSIDRLYSLRELSAANSGVTVEYLRDLVSSGDIDCVRRGRLGRIYIRLSAFNAWQERNTKSAKPQPVVVQLNPPHKAPASKREPVNIDDLLPPGHKRVFARSA